MKMKTRVLIVDDHPVVREGLALQINRQSDLAVCGEAQSPAEALEQVAACGPDVAVVDLVLADSDGLDLIRDLAARYPQLPVLAFSVRDERLYAPRALQAGAKGYIMKQEATERLVDAIRHVLAGHVYLSDRMRCHFLDRLTKHKNPLGESPVEQLSDRELEVFCLLGEGLQTREIAARLHISVKTVETCYERIKIRLSAKSFRDLVRHATLWVVGRRAD